MMMTVEDMKIADNDCSDLTTVNGVRGSGGRGRGGNERWHCFKKRERRPHGYALEARRPNSM